MSYENNNPLHKLSAEEADTSSGYEFGQKPKVEDHGDEGGHDAVNFGHGSHGAHAAGGGHGTEMGWLVSYADMMTLLFGLFVLLYTMSTTNSKGSVEEQMKKMSQEAFGGSVSANDQKEISPDEMLQKLLDKNKKLAADLQKSQEELTLKRDLTTVETEKKMMQQKIDELTKRMQDNETIQKEMTSKVEEQKRQIASIPDITLKIQTVSLENQKMKVELDRAQTKEKELVEKMKNMTPKEKTEASAPVNPNNFLMISTTWATEKHDIDLEIVDTNNKKFNFKKKSYGGVDGQFEIDSRYGPGLEMWKTPKLRPGKYKVKVTLYNSNGNDEPAEVQTNVITVSENRKLQKITLSKTAKTKEIRFNVDEKGKITLE